MIPPGGDQEETRPRPLSGDEHRTLVRNLAAVDTICDDHGLTQVLHPHLQTVVETSPDVERVLEGCDVRWCLDTGHLLLAGGDPVAAVRRWAGRIGQVHLKDADLAVHERVRAAGGGLADVVAAGGFCPLGTGDVDFAGVLAGPLVRSSYRAGRLYSQAVGSRVSRPPVS